MSQPPAAVADHFDREGIIGIGEVAHVKLAGHTFSVGGSIALVGGKQPPVGRSGGAMPVSVVVTSLSEER